MYLTRKVTDRYCPQYHYTDDGRMPICDEPIRPECFRTARRLGEHSKHDTGIVCAACMEVMQERARALAAEGKKRRIAKYGAR